MKSNLDASQFTQHTRDAKEANPPIYAGARPMTISTGIRYGQ